MPDKNEIWDEYRKLVIRELEILNERQENADKKIIEMDKTLVSLKNIETELSNNKQWIKDVNEVWPPSQMKSAKDEIYKQKNKWIAVVAILAFVEIVITVCLTIWAKLH